MSFERAVRSVFGSEGGYNNSRHDRGGETNLGITIGTLRAAQKSGLVPAHITPKTLTREYAKLIYQKRYWDPYHLDKVMWPVSLVVFDAVVNHGSGGMALTVQRALVKLGATVTVDGKWGPKTRAALIDMSKLHPMSLSNAIIDERLKYYDKIVINDPSQKINAKGWANRMIKLRKEINR